MGRARGVAVGVGVAVEVRAELAFRGIPERNSGPGDRAIRVAGSDSPPAVVYAPCGARRRAGRPNVSAGTRLLWSVGLDNGCGGKREHAGVEQSGNGACAGEACRMGEPRSERAGTPASARTAVATALSWHPTCLKGWHTFLIVIPPKRDVSGVHARLTDASPMGWGWGCALMAAA